MVAKLLALVLITWSLTAPGYCFELNNAEFNTLFASPHAYGRRGVQQNTCPTFTVYNIAPPPQPTGGRGRGGFNGFGGFGGRGFGGGGFGGGGFGGAGFAAAAASSVQLTGAEFSLSNHGGNFNVGGSITLSSMLGTTTMVFGSTHGGGGGSTTTLHSTFTPPSLAAAAAVANATGVNLLQAPPQQNPLLMLHGFNASMITLLTNPRNTHAAAVLGRVLGTVGRAAYVGARVEGVLRTGQLVQESLEEAREKVQAEKGADAAAATGGDGKEPEKKPDDDKKYPDNPKEAKENLDDGSVWEKDTAGHGGEQWKRWTNKRSWEKGETPTSVWPDGRVRK